MGSAARSGARSHLPLDRPAVCGRGSTGMIEIAGVQFPLTFEPQTSAREVVLLGIVPIGAIERMPIGRWCWSVDLPMIRQMHRAPSLEGARDCVREALLQWFEAAAVSRAGRPAR